MPLDATPEYSLASLPAIKKRVDVATDNADFDVSLMDFARLATQYIEGELGLTFREQSYTEFKDTMRNYSYRSSLMSMNLITDVVEDVRPTRILLRGYPLAADATLEARYDSGDRLWPDETVIAADQYVLSPETGRVEFLCPFDTASRALKITYTAGFPVDYETPAEGSDREAQLSEDADVSSELIFDAADAVAILFDGTIDRNAAACGVKPAASAYVQWDFPTARVAANALWYSPNDATACRTSGAANITEVTLALKGSVSGNWTGGADEAAIASRTYTGVQPSDEFILSAGSIATAFKSFRLTMSAPTAANVYASQVGLALKDTDRGFLRNVPSRLAMACAILTKYLWSKDRTGGIGFRSSVERRGASFTTDGVMPPEVVELLQPYRRLRMG